MIRHQDHDSTLIISRDIVKIRLIHFWAAILNFMQIRHSSTTAILCDF